MMIYQNSLFPLPLVRKHAFKKDNIKTSLYFASDSILCKDILDALEDFVSQESLIGSKISTRSQKNFSFASKNYFQASFLQEYEDIKSIRKIQSTCF
jgi:hypothetical protein